MTAAMRPAPDLSLPLAAPTPPLLAVNDLTTEILVGTGPRRVVDGLSFSVGAGETLAVVGESGSGKSLAMLSLTGLLPSPPALVTGGRAMFEGADLLAMGDRALRRVRGSRIGMVFQEPMSALNPLLTVGDQIAETLTAHRGLSWSAARAEAVRLLDRVRIADAAGRAGQHPHQFSGGMRQRVVIAAAIAARPALLIADEPTTALDATVEAEILALLKALQAEDNLAIILITHDMGVVRRAADRVLVMHGGREVESGPTAEVLTTPRADYTRTLVAATLYAPAQVQPAPVSAADAGSPEAKARPLLKVMDLTVAFPLPPAWPRLRPSHRFLAVAGVSFALAAGETLAIVGESGSGKTTVARAILGLQPAEAGRVLLNGHDVGGADRDSRTRRAGIQMVFQDPQASLDPRFDAEAIITEPLRFVERRGDRTARAAELLALVGLPADALRRRPHELSGGQRQRLGIARALSVEPKIVVADEAVSALDATTRLKVLELLRELQARLGIAYLFITHDLSVVARLAHQVAIMQAGQIVEIGPVEAVTRAPAHPYSRTLLAALQGVDRGDAAESPLIAAGPRRLPIGEAPPSPVFDRVGPGHLVARSP